MSSETAGRSNANTNSNTGRPEYSSAVVREDFQTMIEDVGSSVSRYCRQRPKMAGLLMFAFGFYVGWKIKPW